MCIDASTKENDRFGACRLSVLVGVYIDANSKSIVFYLLLILTILLKVLLLMFPLLVINLLTIALAKLPF